MTHAHIPLDLDRLEHFGLLLDHDRSGDWGWSWPSFGKHNVVYGFRSREAAAADAVLWVVSAYEERTRREIGL